jgi:hypothetical protein
MTTPTRPVDRTGIRDGQGRSGSIHSLGGALPGVHSLRRHWLRTDVRLRCSRCAPPLILQPGGTRA